MSANWNWNPIYIPKVNSTPNPNLNPNLNLNRNYRNVRNKNQRSIYDKYCSCIFKVTASNRARNYSGSPYAICTSSIYNRQGLRGPGSSLRCQYEPEYLDDVTSDQIYWYAVAKNLVPENTDLSDEEIKEIILDFWYDEGKLL